MDRKRFLELGAFALGIALVGSPDKQANNSQDIPVGDFSAQADAAYLNMRQLLFYPDLNLFRPNTSFSWIPKIASFWSHTVAIDATLHRFQTSISRINYLADLEHQIAGTEQYRSDPTQPFRGSFAQPPGAEDKIPFAFYDDNGVISLALLKYYQLSQKPEALTTVTNLFDNFIAGGVTTSGGMRWMEKTADSDKDNLAFNATAINALVCFELSTLTNNPSYAHRAQQMWQWCSDLKDPSNGLYSNGYSSEGKLEAVKWSYNQGFAIACNQKLYELTGNPHYLATGREVALTSLDYFRRIENKGIKGLCTQPTVFNAYFFRYLEKFLKAHPDPELFAQYRKSLINYATEIVTTARFRQPSGLYHLSLNDNSQLREQAATVQILSLAA